MKNTLRSITIMGALAVSSLFAPMTLAQQQVPSKVDISWNRYYDSDETTEIVHKLVKAYPDLLSVESLGKSEQGRDLWVITLNNKKTGKDTDKPAMYIDGNVHGNEIQATETVLYSIWYLTKSYGEVDQLTELIDRVAFYFVPSQNPDGRAEWFANPNSPHSARTGQRPTDNDYDGQLDEDGPDDLDGDGHITQMWKIDPNGRYRRNEIDPRIIERAPQGVDGNLTRLGSEGIDNDGDGQVNEDGPGGYDMNRNWASDWQPNYIQYGAGEYPFDSLETNVVAQFILKHPNIAAGQSYHNTGGMMLRGPGASYLDKLYSRSDRNVYDQLGKAGEDLLPYYDYMVIHADLYTVHGGFVNWLAEGLGIVSFTNELWTDSRIMPDPSREFTQEERMHWQDRMLFGQTFTDFTEYEHPQHGQVLIGGGTKYSSRVTPPFMLEEGCHRNFAFTMFHAQNMPDLQFKWAGVKQLEDQLWEITVEIENTKIIPTRLGISATKKIGFPDMLTIEGVTPVLAGTVSNRYDRTLNPVDERPERMLIESGIRGKSMSTFRYLVTGKSGTRVKLGYSAEKASDIHAEFHLKPGEIDFAD
ncbi:MAG: M14 family metallopeptidase [Phycisphaerales bacterium]|nr:M14 family metallopeptidase [Phycisphaerales bacterium]